MAAMPLARAARFSASAMLPNLLIPAPAISTDILASLSLRARLRGCCCLPATPHIDYFSLFTTCPMHRAISLGFVLTSRPRILTCYHHSEVMSASPSAYVGVGLQGNKCFGFTQIFPFFSSLHSMSSGVCDLVICSQLHMQSRPVTLGFLSTLCSQAAPQKGKYVETRVCK